MKAAVLNAFGSPLAIENLPAPVLGSGEVIVDVVAAGIAGYTAGVLSGARNYMLEVPIVPGPGGIGRVRAVGPDATKLKPGDWVYCDSTIRSRDDVLEPDTILLGWTARTPAAMKLHRFYHHGSFAEQVLLPTENVTPIGTITPAEAGRWTALGRLLVPYGGLLAGDLKAGETVLVSGATGGFGGAGVAVALAMGAARVIAAGRNRKALDALVARHGVRVVPVAMSGVGEEDGRCIAECAAGPIDFVLDFLPREAKPAQVETAIRSVRHGGRVVLMGGVRGDLALDYNWIMHNNVVLRGQWMYERSAVPRMVQMVRAGLIDLSAFAMTEFALADANAAVAYAAENTGPNQLTVLRPDR